MCTFCTFCKSKKPSDFNQIFFCVALGLQVEGNLFCHQINDSRLSVYTGATGKKWHFLAIFLSLRIFLPFFSVAYATPVRGFAKKNLSKTQCAHGTPIQVGTNSRAGESAYLSVPSPPRGGAAHAFPNVTNFPSFWRFCRLKSIFDNKILKYLVKKITRVVLQGFTFLQNAKMHLGQNFKN